MRSPNASAAAEDAQLAARKQAERETYDRMYQSGSSFGGAAFRKYYLADSERAFADCLARRAPGARVLEIGCGDGAIAIRTAILGAADVIGVDISAEGVSAARAAAAQASVEGRTQFEVMDVEQLAFADSSFDLVINHEVFSSIDIAQVLPEIHRVLKPGGVLLGKESLGHNPLFNLNRSIKRLFGRRTAWAVSHIVREEDFDNARSLFRIARRECFHFFSVFGIPLWRIAPLAVNRVVSGVLISIDRIVFRLPPLRRYAFKVVFELEKKV